LPTKYSQKQRMPRTAVETEDLVMLCICDYSGQVRGKGFPASELPARLKSGVCFGSWFATISKKLSVSFDEYSPGPKIPRWLVEHSSCYSQDT